MSHSFFIQPTDLCNTFHNYFFLIEIGPIFYRWQNENNQKIFDYHLPPSLLRWENILNHFPQNLYQTIWRREKFYHFDKQAFWISKLKNYFSSRNKNGNGNGVSRFRRMDKSDHWEKLLTHARRPPVYFLCIDNYLSRNNRFIFALAAF